MTPRLLRRVQRTIHLAAAIMLSLSIYSPLGDEASFQITVRFVTVPVLIIIGLGIWSAPKWMARRRRATATAVAR